MRLRMKKIIKSILSLSMILFIWLSLCHWAPFWVSTQDDYGSEFPYDKVEKIDCDGKTDLWSCVSIKESWDETIIKRLLKVFNLDIDETSDHKFIDYVRAILNVALGLISMVALVMTIYTFYLMFFTENEAWAKKAKQSLVGIFIALAIIWLSWLIVSFIFRWYENSWYKRQGEIKEAAITLMVDQELSNQIYLNV